MFAFYKPLRDPSEVQAGDIIGFSGEGLVSAGITLATWGLPYLSLSHVGIMGRTTDGRLLLFESTTLNKTPCEITGKAISGSQAHTLGRQLEHYRGKVWHYPLYRPLFDHEDQRLTEFLESTIGLPYDMIGAFRAGGRGFSWLEARLREQDLHALFCSEWCAAAHAAVGIFATDNASRWSPNLFTRTERRAGILHPPRGLQCAA